MAAPWSSSASGPSRFQSAPLWAAIPIIISVICGVIVLTEDEHSLDTAVSPAVIGSGCLQSPHFSLWRDMECMLRGCFLGINELELLKRYGDEQC